MAFVKTKDGFTTKDQRISLEPHFSSVGKGEKIAAGQRNPSHFQVNDTRPVTAVNIQDHSFS